ncbi:MBL fold metallo-hydrolase [Chitinophaga sancti]|uniref:MBL fold metallo-hydrolase n=1 Tax=Chitinophaga sancti TaxID=1004 RepID=UPI003F792E61
MKIEQIYTGCLAHGAYYIESDGVAAIVDPLREVAPYIQKAATADACIKYVLETHFHADFVSGHLELSAITGATIVYGPTAQPGFPAYVAADNEFLFLGKCTIQVLHTPGHTPESSSYLLYDEFNKPVALFSGDTLFIGDVGRPDLAQKAANMTREELAGVLFDSLRNKIMTLPGDITVYPGHGAGSSCGKNMSRETSDTLANQLATNYALRKNMTREEFIVEVTSGLTTPPAYFPENVRLNKEGATDIGTVVSRGLHALLPGDFEAVAHETGALILDARDPEEFATGFIPGAINIGIDGSFAPWAGTLIPDIEQPILIVAPTGREEEVIIRLARVGYDFTLGYLKGGILSWMEAHKPIDRIITVKASSLTGAEHIVDVRRKSEFDTEHVMDAIHAPLDYINDSMLLLDKEKLYYIHCAAGYRSMMFISILKARGYDHLVDVRGGLKAIREASKLQLTDYVCPMTQL